MTTAPRSTYRLQIRPGFTLDDAAGVLDYLVDLGVDAVYLSPLLTSTVGSDHGYDVTDPTTIDSQRGGEEAFGRFVTAARSAGLGVTVDIVPNHLGVQEPEQNPAWWDVLTYGRDSAYADWFDIDWTRPKLLLPVLGDDPAAADDLRVSDGRLCYWEHRFPIAPGTGEGSPAEVHARQHYRLVSWRTAFTELGYRRFFAVSTLAGVRVEDPAVFDATHGRIATMIEQGVTGLRVDHPDGLAEPGGYLRRLRKLAPQAWITVEKILEPGEQLPDWPVAGTTGYDALAGFGGVFLDPAAEERMTETYRRLTGDHRDIAAHVRDGKQLVLSSLFGPELRRISALTDEPEPARQVISEAAARFDVYRSYLPEGGPAITAVLDEVREEHPELADTVDALQPRLVDPADELAVRFQQLTGAVMAKGVEDTAFYRYNRLTSLNEVGGDPGTFGLTPAAFHAAQRERLRHHPEAMTTLSTHDTKRSEDVRAAITVLAEVPDRWEELAGTLMRQAPMPEPTIAYLLWQLVATVGPIDRGRLHGYAEKAMREAAVGTGWTDPDEAFEAAVHAALDRAYDDPELSGLLADFRATIAPAATAVALGQKLVQLTAPGIPDVYQGTELFDDSLVDPDNRRPVDFSVRRARLAALDRAAATAGTGPAVDSHDTDRDDLKLLVTCRALRARQQVPLDGYRPLLAEGPAADHLIGFDRGGLITVATRLPWTLAGRWGGTELTLPDGHWTDRLTGNGWAGRTQIGELLGSLPVALLTRD